MKVSIVKYCAGNLFSVINAIKRLGIEPEVTDDTKVLLNSDKVIFPGVGEAGSAMKYLAEHNLIETLKNIQKPFLGICLGMQLLCKYSEENNTECLGIFDIDVKRFPNNVRVPHIGWNQINDTKLAFNNIPDDNNFYFVHSYYVPTFDNTISTCEYGVTFSAVIKKDNYLGVQFHPEKSGTLGEKFLKEFLDS